MDKLPFRPVVGTDNQIKNQEPSEGYVWFATDSKKIYYSNGETHLAMGGNSNIYYGIMDLVDTPDEGQKEFWFTIFDIDGNDEVENGNYLIPNIDDLILNIGKSKADGCFYRVLEIEGTGENTNIKTEKLTIAGSGGSTSGPDINSGKMDFQKITNSPATCLYNQDFFIEFLVTAVDASGENTGNGSYTVVIDNIKVTTGIAFNGVKTSVNIGPYLKLRSEPQEVRIYATMDVGGSDLVTQSKRWDVTTTQVEVKWDYNESTLNSTNNALILEWEVSGSGIEKTTHILIDEAYEILITKKSNYFDLIIDNLLDYNLTHGVHKFEMWATFSVDGFTTIPTPKIIKNLIFYTIGNDIPIISCNFFKDNVIQYNTVEIPVVFYQYGNNGNLTAVLKENGVEVDTWTNIINGEKKIWYYTPLESTTRNLTIQCGQSEKTLILEVEALDIDNEEIPNYTFRFKASDFSSNNAIENWNSNNVTATFSPNFDWINGGLKSEKDEKGNVRQYLRIKAGTTMTINYNLFQTRATVNGKAFKFIFRADYCRDYDALVLKCYDDNSNIGLKMQAQQALLQGSENSVIVPYCEDSYIEFEFDITKTDSVKRYLMPWLDGVPTVFKQYGSEESFYNNEKIVIGSPDCDVCVYMIKLYEKHLNNDQHLQNFIADAMNAQEMLDRFNRNDILDEERQVISPIKLAEKNPNCRVHVYDIDRMTLTKKDPVEHCEYIQYHGSRNPVLTANEVKIKVQGTSSAAYGLSAFNIDSEFTQGFTQADGTTTEGWSMNPDSIPVNYFCTKVNVASAEHANNALNQEWYNKFQPYKTKLRQKNPKARDCMEFVPGVLFIKDKNKQADLNNSKNYISNNLFAEIPGYIDDPYERMYSICNMGNSKKNVEVLHDTTNPIEYCIEVGDNQKPTQWMTNNIYDDSHWDAEKPDWEFRYPDGHKELENESTNFISPLTGEKVSNRQHAFDSWRRFINWMATCNPQPKYKKLIINSQEEFDNASKVIIESEDENKPDEIIYIDLYEGVYDEENNLISHILAENYNKDNNIYYIMTDNIHGYTLEKLPSPIEYSNYTFNNSEYSKNLLGVTVNQYKGIYTHDTYEYRMAKMLNECENYLVMDSVLFHFLFIERHSMIDNVAKNTFWSTEDGYHWNLTKNYDNDTSDGNDNQGKLTLTYGIEPFDTLPTDENDYYFNADQAVWFRFCGGLYEACKALHGVLGGENGAWNSKTYLQAFSDWQKTIPERCWIEDYYRKYIRPLEIYGDRMFVDMLEGGQKTHQRKQFETYQDYYISSKYAGSTALQSKIIIRGNDSGDINKKIVIPLTVYSDCYIQAAFGSGADVPNASMRVKRNTPITVRVPESLGTLTNATIYFFLPELYQSIGDLERGNLSSLQPEQLSVSSATKLRSFIAGQVEDTNMNYKLKDIGFDNNIMLEELYMANYPGAKITLNLTSAINLKTLDLRNSGFTGIYIADGAPLETMKLCQPTTLVLSNLRNLNTLEIQEPEKLTQIVIDNIDNNENINSKNNIVDICENLNTYRLKNVNWIIDDVNEIVNNKIDILEKILHITPYTPQGQAESETSATSLTGTLIIKASAYNSNDSLDIYNRYAVEDIINEEKTEKRFPKLDIQFEGDNAKLFTITILKDNNNILWTRKLRPNDDIDTIFLENGPDGAFDINTIYKSPTEYNTYTFANKWEVWNSDDNTYITTIDRELPTYTKVNGNLTFIPIFNEEPRLWNVTLKQEDDILISIQNIKAGTLLSDVINEYYPTIPWKDDSKLSLMSTYSFEGYAFSKTASSALKLENYKVTSDITLFAIFKETSVYNNVHENYWNYDVVNMAYPADNNIYEQRNTVPNKFVIETGVSIIPNPQKQLKGKITIPAEISGYPVFKIQTRAFRDNTNITHIFFEPAKNKEVKTNIRVIDQEAFTNSNIKYFEFSDGLRYIGSKAFQLCRKLEPINQNYNFGNNIFYIGPMAFNQALNFNGNPCSLEIASTLKFLGAYAISNLAAPVNNSTITIGKSDLLSVLDLSTIPGGTPGGTDSSEFKCINDGMGRNGYFSLTFYSQNYDSENIILATSLDGEEYTVGSVLGLDNMVKEITVSKGG